MVRCGMTDKFDVICSVCIVSECKATVHLCVWLRQCERPRDVGKKRQVSVHARCSR